MEKHTERIVRLTLDKKSGLEVVYRTWPETRDKVIGWVTRDTLWPNYEGSGRTEVDRFFVPAVLSETDIVAADQHETVWRIVPSGYKLTDEDILDLQRDIRLEKEWHQKRLAKEKK